jgi:hypothetical protein
MKVFEHACPECGADKHQACKAPPPLPMSGVHNKRWDQLQVNGVKPISAEDSKRKKR